MTYPTTTETHRFAYQRVTLSPASGGRPLGLAAFAALTADLTGGIAKRSEARRRRLAPPGASLEALVANRTVAYRAR